MVDEGREKTGVVVQEFLKLGFIIKSTKPIGMPHTDVINSRFKLHDFVMMDFCSLCILEQKPFLPSQSLDF